MSEDRTGATAAELVRAPRASVVVPTRDRRALLDACLRALAASTVASQLEVIVVDDGSTPPVDEVIGPAGLAVAIVRSGGVGPAQARNAGIARARAPIVLFTDDDTVAAAGWAEAALAYLDDHPECVGVEGPVDSRRWDPLTEHSVETALAGHHWTCNVGYRRRALLELGGFRSDIFRFAHAEDRELGVRAQRIGPIGFEWRMLVEHSPRRQSLRHVVRQARWVRDDLVLYALHPELVNGFSYPVRPSLLHGSIARWWRALRHDGEALTPRRAARALGFAIVGSTVTALTMARTPRASVLRARCSETNDAHTTLPTPSERRLAVESLPVDAP